MKYLVILLLFFTNIYVFTNEYKYQDLEKVHTFLTHNNTEAVAQYKVYAPKHPRGPEPTGPSLMFIDDQILLLDHYKGRVLYLDTNFNLLSISDVGIWDSQYKIIINNFLVTGDNLLGEAIAVYDLGNKFDIIAFMSTTPGNADNYFKKFKDFKDLYYFNNDLFFIDRNNKLWCIKNFSKSYDENKSNLMNESETLNFLNTTNYKDFYIDDNKRFFYNNKLKTISFYTFFTFYKDIHGSEIIPLDNVKLSKKSTHMTFLGNDIEGNFYWGRGTNRVVIFNNEGIYVDTIRYDINKTSTYPIVSPKGDLYFMHHSPEVVTLYKINRKW